MRGSVLKLPGLGVAVAALAAGALASAVPPPAVAQTAACAGINTMVPHGEGTESALFHECEVLQGTEGVEDAAHAAIAPHALAAAVGALRGQTEAVTGAISGHLRDLSRDLALGTPPAAGARYLGMSAGAPDSRVGVWDDASGSFLNDSSAVGYDGTSVTALAGIDYIIDRKWVVGLSTGYVHSDLNLKSVASNREADGGLVGPYASYIIAPNMSVDLQFSFTGLSNTLTSGLVGSSGGFYSNRVIGASNFNYYIDRGPWKLTGIGGYTYSWEGSESTLLSSSPPFANEIRYSVVKFGGEAGYMLQPRLEAYAPLNLNIETTTPRDGTSRVALVFGGGLRYQWSDQIKAGLLVTTTQIKTHWQDVLVGANLRISF